MINSNVLTQPTDAEKLDTNSKSHTKLQQWLNKNFRIRMTDGRILYGVFACTDRDGNIILGSCSEYLSEHSDPNEERVLGLIMVPGRHIVSIQFDDTNYPQKKMPYTEGLNKIMTDCNSE